MTAVAGRVGRDGALRLGFERRSGRTVLARCRYTLPLQVLAPVALDDAACVVSVLNPTGGLVGGDRLILEIEVAAGAHACLTTPSATKVYRADGPPATQDVRISVAPGARLEWVPDHTIPFAGAALCQRLTAEIGDGAALIAIDAFAAGRVARGEAWRFTRLESALEVVDAAGPVLLDRFALAAGGVADATGGHPYFATLAVIADTGVERFASAVDALPATPGAEVGVGLLARRGALVRCLAADAHALGTVLDAVWGTARHEVLGLPPLALRKC